VSGGLASLAAGFALAALFAAERGLGARSPSRRLAAASCVAVALLVGCGGEASPPVNTSAATAATRTAATTPPKTTTLSAAAQAHAEARRARQGQIALERSFAPNRWREPGATAAHRHEALNRLIVREDARGRGPPLTGHENVYVNFVKTYWKSGRKFLVAWGPASANYFSLPAEPDGIRRGMIGMRAGGRRTISMPERIADVHEPHHKGGMEAATIVVVLRNIIHLPRE
jgi:FKBP-type peptidyl-prolyl cis-trans isomerase